MSIYDNLRVQEKVDMIILRTSKYSLKFIVQVLN